MTAERPFHAGETHVSMPKRVQGVLHIHESFMDVMLLHLSEKKR